MRLVIFDKKKEKAIAFSFFHSMLNESAGVVIIHNRSVSADLPFYRRPCRDRRGTARRSA
jgi:hypothetical protein